MKVVVFDFDGTLTKDRGMRPYLGLVKKSFLIKLPFYWLIEKMTRRPLFHKAFIQSLEGVYLSDILKASERLRERKEAIKLLEIFDQKGYRIAVVSYALKPVIEHFLNKRGLEPEIYAMSPNVVDGKISGYSDDWVTQTLLNDPDHAKKKILSKLNIEPNIAVGDNKKRDDLAPYYIPANRAGSILRGMGGQML